ncbi:hypothetical protein BJ508DRAFT_315167 [Ascobolus immersus RN42]|uniref:BTB domain-containing protein n=1 Tax=Ascobolus immersus RN42 TaxID=1160509 RepID=A0A3N4HC02_ASCIM|nr:hypothetical protein BJ508DRAFT_315167 [Ascobolus immersus RN42]
MCSNSSRTSTKYPSKTNLLRTTLSPTNTMNHAAAILKNFHGYPIPSAICRGNSPIITICLRRPSQNGAREVAGQSASRLERVASSLETGDDGNPEYIATFQVHLSVLVQESLYFGSLLSFDGAEARERKVILECATGYATYLDEIAFSCLVDHLYTGVFVLENYGEPRCTPLENPYKVAWEPRFGEDMVLLAALYCLGERLLVESFKKSVLIDMYTLLTAMHMGDKCK